MGAWGYGPLESDNGLDTISEICGICGIDEDNFSDNIYSMDKTINTTILKEKFRSIIENKYTDTFAVMYIYASFGIADVFDKDIQENIFNFEKNQISIWNNPSERLKIIENVEKQVLENKPFSCNDKGLFETMATAE